MSQRAKRAVQWNYKDASSDEEDFAKGPEKNWEEEEEEYIPEEMSKKPKTSRKNAQPTDLQTIRNYVDDEFRGGRKFPELKILRTAKHYHVGDEVIRECIRVSTARNGANPEFNRSAPTYMDLPEDLKFPGGEEKVLEEMFNKPNKSRYNGVKNVGKTTGLDFLAVCKWFIKRSELEERAQREHAPEEAPALPENAPEEAPDFQEDPRGMSEERELDPQDEFFEVGFHNQDDGLVDEMSQPHDAGLSNTDTMSRQMSEEQEEEKTDKEANDSAAVSEEHELSAEGPAPKEGEDEFLESLEAIRQLFESVDHVVRVTSLERSEVRKLLHQQSNTPDDEFGLLQYKEQIRKVLYFFKRDEEKIDLKVLEKWAECDLDLLENIFETVKQEWRTEARNNTTQGHPAVMPNPRNSLNPPYFRYHQDNDHFREPQRIMNEEGSRVEKEHSNVTNALNLQYPLNHQNLPFHKSSQNHQAQQWQTRQNENLRRSSAIAPNSRSPMDLQNVPSHESNQHDQANSNQHCPQQSSSRRIKMEPADDRAVQNVGASKRKRKHIHHVTEEQMQSKRVKTERDEDNSSSSRNLVADLPSHHRSEENQTQLPQREIKPEPRDDNES